MYLTSVLKKVAQTNMNKSTPRPCNGEGLIELGLYFIIIDHTKNT
ncbi:hypothetical protein GYH30_051748 [Glycine max]|nr:hypothetical protein GYH30_051748 [Glycine max]